jgi:serine/threonine protein kinase
MKIPDIKKQEPLAVRARVSRLARVEFARYPYPVLLKEPAQFWNEIFIANEANLLGEVTHPRVRRKLAFDAATHRLFLEYIEGATLHELVRAGVTRAHPGRTHRLLQSVAETMADLHAGILCGRPIVHNDLKDMNVLVPDAAPEETRLIDFSHSYFEGNPPSFILDKKHNPAGTARYTAPEKWEGDFTKGGLLCQHGKISVRRHPGANRAGDYGSDPAFAPEISQQCASQHGRRHHGLPGKKSRPPTVHGTGCPGLC